MALHFGIFRTGVVTHRKHLLCQEVGASFAVNFSCVLELEKSQTRQFSHGSFLLSVSTAVLAPLSSYHQRDENGSMPQTVQL